MAKQDPGRVGSLAALQLVRLESEDGTRLGHVFDLRTEYDPARPDRPPVVTEILYGTIGLLERLGVRRTRPRTIPWKSVIAIHPHAIVVRKTVKVSNAR